MIKLETNLGTISIVLDKENTAKTAENFSKYAKEGFYDGLIFHRVIKGFMVQGGGFKPNMVAKSAGKPIMNEADLGGKNLRGTIAMARTNDPHSASAQFFINLVDNDFLNHKSKTPEGWGYCVFGHVTEGMDIVDRIGQVKTTAKSGHRDVPEEDIIIERAVVEESTG